MFIVFVTRHYNQKKRVSGVISYLNLLQQALRNQGVKTSILYTKNKAYKDYGPDKSAYITCKNPWIIAQHLKRLQPTHVILISSTADPSLLYWWWLSVAFVNQKRRCYMYQTTNFKKQPNKMQLCFLKRLVKGIIVGNSNLYKIFEGLPKRTLMKPAVMINSTNEKVKYLPQKRFTVLFMGHYSKIKGVDIFLDLSQRPSMAEYSFCIAGAIPKKDKSFYKRAVEIAKQNANLTVLGYLNSPQSMISNCDVLLIPYRRGDTVLSVAQTALEGMAAGKPIITTHNTATNDLVIDGVNGYICSSISSMEKRLLSLKQDPWLYNKLAQNAVVTIRKEFNIEERAQQLVRYLNARI